MSPDDFKNHVKFSYQKIGKFVNESQNAFLQSRWEDWDLRFKKIHKLCNERPEVAISLVGGTGAGKSTLLNALIGARVLPVGNMRACTSAISEVAFAEGAYRAKVEFVTRESWQKEIDLLLSDLRDAKKYGGEIDDENVGPSISRAAEDKLKAVYAADKNQDQLDFFNLEEPTEITRALNKGYENISSPSLKEFSAAIKPFLDSNHRYWPLVKRVVIHGPFEVLRDGAKLIDLPGLNDPNEAREEVTKTHLKGCRFVWIVFGMKRSLTADIIELMQSGDFLRQIVMDGRSEALTFVGTASDDMDFDAAIDELKLDEDASYRETVSARNLAIRSVLAAQLDDLAGRMADLSGEDKGTAIKLAKQLKASRVVTTSSKEYLRLSGLSRTHAGPLEHVDETEIPALRMHMRKICSGYGLEAHIASLNRQLKVLVNEISRDIHSQRTILNSQAAVSEKQRKDIQVAVDSARGFLDRDLTETRERLEQDLESDQKLLAERIRRAVERAQLQLEETTIRRWSRTHHGTLRAACRRQGVYVGTGGRTDFAADLCKPILDGIAFAWSDFFGEKIAQSLQKWTDRLHRNSAEFRISLLRGLNDSNCMSTEALRSLTAVLDSTDKILDELLAQTRREVDDKVLEKQRTLYEKVPEQISANMQIAFENAALEQGAGMKQRIVEILSAHARQVSKVMFDDAQDVLIRGVRGLNQWVVLEFGNMVEAVTRNATIANHNLTVDNSNSSSTEIETSLSALTELESLLDELLNVASPD